MSRIRLTQAEGDRLVNRLRNTNLDKFHTLCKMHLSFLLHLPGSSLEEFLGDTGTPMANVPATHSADKSKLNFRNFGKKKPNKDPKALDSTLSQETIDQVLPLVEYLGLEQNLTCEGLFRKTGHIGRQRLLIKKLHSGEDVRLELENGVYSAHDCASVLKAFLSHLPEPVLTEKHYLAHCQIPEMEQEPKQLQTLQLLLQLLPTENLFLFRCLLTLLHKVAQEPSNKMTSETLGTVFAPHLLVPRKMSASELQAAAPDLTRTVAFMIDNMPDLFKLPRPLVRDIATYWAQMEESTDSEAVRSEEETPDGAIRNSRIPVKRDVPITTSVTFADRQASQQAAEKTDTQVALAQLYAHVSSMPESVKKQRLLKQFNKANNVHSSMTPAQPNDKHKRTKSFGDSLKKIVRGNHKRRGSGHKLQIHNVGDESTFPVTLGKYTARLTEHTPEMPHCSLVSYDSPSAPRSDNPLHTPRLRLFDERLCESVTTPSSPPVHIVDMKENTDPKTMFRKRKTPCEECPVTSTPSFGSLYLTPAQLARRAHQLQGSALRKPSPLEMSRKRLTRCSPVKGTPDRRFERPVAFISPITRTINKATPSIQTSVMTPGSRTPLVVLRTP